MKIKHEEIEHNREIYFSRKVNSTDYEIVPSHSETEVMIESDSYLLYIHLLRNGWIQKNMGFAYYTMENPYFQEK